MIPRDCAAFVQRLWLQYPTDWQPPAAALRVDRVENVALIDKPQHRNLREMLVVCRKNISLLNRARRYPYVVLGNHPPRTLKCLVYLGVV